MEDSKLEKSEASDEKYTMGYGQFVNVLKQYCGHFSSEFSDDKSRNLIKKNTHVNLCFLNQTQEIKLTLI